MKLYNNFKIALWIILLLSVSSLLVFRYSAIAAGTSSTSDIFILLFWIVLMLAPIFRDINMFGPRLKQSIESLKDQVQNLMFTVQSQTQSVNINNYPIPPSDNEIAQRQKEVEEVLGKGVSIRSLQDDSIPENPELNYLFNLRRSIETELRRIESIRLGFDWDYRRFSFSQIIQRFVQADLMPLGLAAAIRDIYAICTAAIHGEQMSPKQIAYAKEIGPQIVLALKRIQ
jgi:hypothetical protein